MTGTHPDANAVAEKVKKATRERLRPEIDDEVEFAADVGMWGGSVIVKVLVKESSAENRILAKSPELEPDQLNDAVIELLGEDLATRVTSEWERRH